MERATDKVHWRSSLLISCTKVTLIASSDTARYTTISRSCLGFWMTVGDDKNSLSWLKMFSHVSFQLNFVVFRSICAIGLIRSANQGTNLDNVVSRPSNYCTSFRFFGLLISVTCRSWPRFPCGSTWNPGICPPQPRTRTSRGWGAC